MLIVGSHSVIWSFLFLLILIIMVVTIDPPDLLVPLLSLALASTTFEYSTTWTLGLAAQRQNWKKIISNEFYFAMSGWARVFCVLLINCDFIPFITSSFLLFSSIVCFGCIQPWDIFWSKLCCSWGVKKVSQQREGHFLSITKVTGQPILQRTMVLWKTICETYSTYQKISIFCFAQLLIQILVNFQNQGRSWNQLVTSFGWDIWG